MVMIDFKFILVFMVISQASIAIQAMQDFTPLQVQGPTLTVARPPGASKMTRRASENKKLHARPGK